MSGFHLTKITGGIETKSFEGLARLLAYGADPGEAEGYELVLSGVNQEPQFEHLAESGLIIISGISTARIALNFDYEQGVVPAIHSASLVASCSVSLNLGTKCLVDPNTRVRVNSGNPGKKAAYYVMSATCMFVE